MVRSPRKNFPSSGDIVQPLQSQPESLGARLAVTLASKEASQAPHHARGLAQARGLWRSNGILPNKTHQSFPLNIFKVNGAGHIRCFSSQFGQMENPPGHDHIDRQAGFDPIGAAQLASLNLAAALERAVEDFDAPSPRVPAQFPTDLHDLL